MDPPQERPPDARPAHPGPIARLCLAVRERLPLWVQMRCAIDPRALAALVVVFLVAVVLAVHHFWAARPQPVRAPAATQATPAPAPAPAPRPQVTASAGVPAAATGRLLVVDVVGKVHRPGIHRLPPGARVADALREAGGVLDGANLRGLNRARLLVDGEQIGVDAPGRGRARWVKARAWEGCLAPGLARRRPEPGRPAAYRPAAPGPPSVRAVRAPEPPP
ncbi:SLBB domain-containing protein [Streptomyces rimosus]|uniref:SLBB domain-containing protein n=1 Tax=Streptomyces rimosus TaxID=1927 RepID=UPI00311EC488